MVPRVLSYHWHDFYEHLKSQFPDLRTSEQLYRYFYGYPGDCYCGKPNKFINFNQGYTKYCSCKCAANANQKAREQTCIKKYGVPNVLMTKESRAHQAEAAKYSNEARSKTCMERYGVQYVSQIPGVIEKIIQSNKDTQRPRFIEKFDLLGYTEDGDWICKCPHPECNKCQEKQYVSNPTLYRSRLKWNTELCTIIQPIGSTHISGLETFIKTILDTHNIQYTKDRKILDGRELDFYIPSLNLAIECNGVYWHSDSKRSRSYHINKYNQCMANGIQLISIWQDQIINTPNKIESLILNKLGLSKTLYARKCEIRSLDKKEARDFFDKHHIQGYSSATIYLGLIYNNQIVCAASFGKRHITKEWELIRFCNVSGTRVVGGAGRLFTYFIKQHNPSKIISYSSNDISDGSLYKALGFTKKSTSLSYWYVEGRTYKRYHRTSFTRKRIAQRWGYDINDKSWTERSVMEERNFYKIFDSGQTRWELDII